MGRIHARVVAARTVSKTFPGWWRLPLYHDDVSYDGIFETKRSSVREVFLIIRRIEEILGELIKAKSVFGDRVSAGTPQFKLCLRVAAATVSEKG